MITFYITLAIYQQRVAAARQTRRAAQWHASLGWDAKQRETALLQAVGVGRLSSRAVAALLPPPAESNEGEAALARARTHLARLREYLAAGPSALSRLRAKRNDQARRAQGVLQKKKRETAQQVAQYESQDHQARHEARGTPEQAAGAQG